jgi:hypothetical protein
MKKKMILFIIVVGLVSPVAHSAEEQPTTQPWHKRLYNAAGNRISNAAGAVGGGIYNAVTGTYETVTQGASDAASAIGEQFGIGERPGRYESYEKDKDYSPKTYSSDDSQWAAYGKNNFYRSEQYPNGDYGYRSRKVSAEDVPENIRNEAKSYASGAERGFGYGYGFGYTAGKEKGKHAGRWEGARNLLIAGAAIGAGYWIYNRYVVKPLHNALNGLKTIVKGKKEFVTSMDTAIAKLTKQEDKIILNNLIMEYLNLRMTDDVGIKDLEIKIQKILSQKPTHTTKK